MMSAFEEHCRGIVSEYVQTVLIIDDGAGLNRTNMDVGTVEEPEDFNNPMAAEVELEHEFEDDIVDEPEEVTHGLNTLDLTSAFYDLGLVAGIFQPKIVEGEQPEEFALKAEKVVATADIVILDWMLVDHDSRYSKAIVKQILSQDIQSGGRLRTIVIYTGESNLHQMRDELWTYLEDTSLKRDADYTISTEHLNIVFYNKDIALNALRPVSEKQLPQKALGEFAVLVDGLVPAFAMKAATTVRQNTGALLARFDSNLDAGYLAHRSLLPNPEDSEVLMLENYASYLRNILALAQVDRQTLGYQKVKDWVEDKYSSCHKKAKISGDNDEEITFSKTNFLESFEHGFTVSKSGLFKAIQSQTSNSRAKLIVKSISNLENIVGAFGLEEGATRLSSQALSALTAFRRTYKDKRVGFPYLTQGTLIKSVDREQYFLCVMPKCDTARVRNKRNFLFAKLTINNGEYDLIAPDISQEESYVHLKTNLKFYQLEDIEFDAKGLAKVEASEDDGSVIFESVQGEKYYWIGDLEDLDIQNKVSCIVGDFNRIGVDEVEWVRRRKSRQN
ncbi:MULTISPECIES: response regulator receiver domain [Vibrio]|uniref:response regulator receiver domain n=1 Tax=Vibrio TaxID=662 RepID=UPI0029643758|nr:response regulator receiver domain [Vibrio sp. Vb1755]MDW1829779.1 response regulator receiver domain [Vibrio sp. Vb1755]